MLEEVGKAPEDHELSGLWGVSQIADKGRQVLNAGLEDLVVFCGARVHKEHAVDV